MLGAKIKKDREVESGHGFKYRFRYSFIRRRDRGGEEGALETR